MPLNIFAIETSCDETSASILSDFKVLSNIVSSQLFHKDYGGIVPELASRAHIKIITQIVSEAFERSGKNKNDIQLAAATQGPGLIGSLLVGYNYAKAFAIANNVPFIGINHIEAHLFSCFIGRSEIEFPFIALVVSGGHTILFLVNDYNDYKILGQTHDDAAGEAFDKGAKMLGLEYPGGQMIDELAKTGDENFHKFPSPHLKENLYDFSFSGIKTSLLYYLRKYFNSENKIPVNDIAASYQKAIINSLLQKTLTAAENFKVSKIAISGGVSANSKLRKEFLNLKNSGYEVFFPEKQYSTDNAAMIGYTAYLKYLKPVKDKLYSSISEPAFARFDYEKI